MGTDFSSGYVEQLKTSVSESQDKLKKLDATVAAAKKTRDALTATALSKEYAGYARWLAFTGIVHGFIFFLAVVVLLAVAICVVVLNIAMSFADDGSFVVADFVARIPMMALMTLPIYAPIVWYAFHQDRLVVKRARMARFYKHKALLGAVFSSLSSQIWSIGEKDVEGEVQLRKRLLELLLDVYGREDIVVAQQDELSMTPVGETLEQLTKTVSALMEVIENLENQGRDEML